MKACLEPPIQPLAATQEAVDTCSQRKRAAKLADVKKFAPKFLSRFQRAYSGRSLRCAVDSFCAECMGYEVSEIAHCTAPACPLYSYRPRGGGKVRGKRANQ